MPSAHESTAFCRLGLMWSCLAQDSCQSDGLWFLQSKEQSARERQAPVSLRSSPVDHSPVELASATQHERIRFRSRSDAACKQFGKNCVHIYEIWVMQMFWQRAKKLPAAGGAVWRSWLLQQGSSQEQDFSGQQAAKSLSEVLAHNHILCRGYLMSA